MNKKSLRRLPCALTSAFKLFSKTGRISIFLLCFNIFSVLAAEIATQGLLFTIKENNIKLENIIGEVEKQSDYLFIYSKNVDVNQKTSVDINKQTLSQTLNKIFNGTNIRYEIDGSYIMLSIKDKKESLEVGEQNKNVIIRGVVTDKNGSPLSGISVVVKGTTRGTVTDRNGRYSLEVTDNSKILSFSNVGFISKDISIDGKTKINVQLEEDNQLLDEVVVVGYGTQRKRDLTGALSRVTAESFKNVPMTNPVEALQGRSAGIMVTSTSGAPGTDPAVRIRGVGTANNTNPLYVVDGLPISGIGWLNPNDIESIEVLKDASASAIYGARAGNGVILVTTKKGKKGEKPVVNFDSYTGISSFYRGLEMMDAEEYVDMQHMLLAANPNYKMHPTLKDKEVILALTERVTGSRTGTDWWKEITHKALMQNYNLSLSGGGDTYTYMTSFGYQKQDGIVKFSDYDKLTWRANTSIDVTKNIKLSSNVGVTRDTRKSFSSDMDRGIMLLTRILDPVTPVYRDKYDSNNPEEAELYLKGYNPNDPYSIYGSSLYMGLNNPVAKAERESQGRLEKLGIRGTVALDINFTDYLSYHGAMSLDLQRQNEYNFAPKYYLKADDYSNTNKVSEMNASDNNWVLENTVTFKKAIGDHNLNILAGMTAEEYNYRNATASKEGIFYNDEYMRALDAATTNPLASGLWGNSALASYLGRINYNFRDKYLFTANVRVDGSSNFAEGSRWGTFPSASLGWVFTEETFVKSLGWNWLDFGKLRAGWGQIGNHNVASMAHITMLGFSNERNYAFGLPKTLQPGVTQTNYANPVKWETTEQLNFGANFSLFNSKLELSADYFIKKTKDMLVTIPTPAFAHYYSPWSNMGNVENRGFEIEVTHRNKIGDFSYQAGFSLFTFKNEVKTLGAGQPINSGNERIGSISRTEVGEPIGYFYGYQTDGIFQNQAEVDNSAQLSSAKPGDLRFVDQNKDGKIDSEDKVMIGNPFPDFSFGINLGGAYKGFDINMLFQGSLGNELFNLTKYWIAQNTGAFNTLKGMTKDAWRAPGLLGPDDPGNPTNKYFKISDNVGQNLAVSDFFVEDGSYLRLKNIQVGYTLPTMLVHRLKIENLRLYLSAQNLFTITGYSGLDPEIGNANPKEVGIDRAFYPQARTYMFGINLTF